MGFYTKDPDKQSGEGLALTEWNNLSNAVAGNSGLTLAINSSDKIGIGTSTPSAKLEVNGNAVVSNVFVGDVGHGSDWAGFAHKNSTGRPNYALLQNTLGSTTLINKKPGEGHIGFCVGNINKMVVLNSGNVGIGTMLPAHKLEVNGDVKATNFIGNGSQLTNLTVGVNGLNLATGSGNVGIGTTNPTEKLQVEGSLKVGGSLKVTGNVGIGTMNPTDKLEVVGNVKATTINGEKPPKVFEVGYGESSDVWHSKIIPSDIVQSYLADGKGGTIRLLLEHKINHQVRTITESIYIKVKNGTIRGWTRQGGGGGDSSFTLGTASKNDVIPNPWDWIWIRNYHSSNTHPNTESAAFQGTDSYKLEILTHPHVEATVIIYDR